MKIGWRVWVEGGAVFDSGANVWADVPADGITYAVVYWERGGDPTRIDRQIISGHDYYFDMVDGSLAANNDDLTTNQQRYPQATAFKRGKWIPVADFEAVDAIAVANYIVPWT